MEKGSFRMVGVLGVVGAARMEATESPDWVRGRWESAVVWDMWAATSACMLHSRRKRSGRAKSRPGQGEKHWFNKQLASSGEKHDWGNKIKMWQRGGRGGVVGWWETQPGPSSDRVPVGDM